MNATVHTQFLRMKSSHQWIYVFSISALTVFSSFSSCYLNGVLSLSCFSPPPAALAMGLCVAMIAFVRLPSLKVSCLLLSGLLIYDVFWVRCTSAVNGTRSSSTNTAPAVTFDPRRVDDSVYQRLFLTRDHLRVGKIIVSWSDKAIRLLKCKRCGRWTLMPRVTTTNEAHK